jgi:Glycosyltransferase family 10 (fucosyltransferase) C-term
MGTKVIGMISEYQGLNQADWLWQQTPHAFGKWKNIQVLAQAPQPDLLLLYNCHNFYKPTASHWLDRFRSPQPLSEVEIRSRLRDTPKEQIISLFREPPFVEKQAKRQADYEKSQIYCGYVSGPDDLAPVPDYMPAIWYHVNSFRELNEMEIPEKVGCCSWITSGIDRTANHRNRLDFLRLLQTQGVEFDLYGRGLPEWAKTNHPLSNKWHGMAPYFYNLSIENYAENRWYVSEKLWDALLAWCLPIYYGGSAADRLLPPGSFLRLPSLDEKGLQYIQEVTATPDAWYEAKAAIAEARQVILHELNLLNWLSKFVDRLG